MLETNGVKVGTATVACRDSGEYTGDGETSMAITGLGFTPFYLRIWKRETVHDTGTVVYETTPEIMDDNAAGGAIAIAAPDPEVRFLKNAIISLDADGFTVDDNGGDEHPNKSGVKYNWFAIG